MTLPSGSDFGPSEILPDVGARLVDAMGQGLGGVQVEFGVSGGSLEASRAVTDKDGLARVGRWALPSKSGTYELRASSRGLYPKILSVRVTAGPPAAISIVKGSGQAGRGGAPLPIRPTVRVLDRFGNPAVGTFVSFTASSPGAYVSQGIAAVTPQGTATAGAWVLGDSAGPQSMFAEVAGLAPVHFAATATHHKCAPLPLALPIMELEGELVAWDCVSAGRVRDVYEVVVREAKPLEIRTVSLTDRFGTVVRIHSQTGELLAEGTFCLDAVATGASSAACRRDSAVWVQFPPGQYWISVSADTQATYGLWTPTPHGKYRLRIEERPGVAEYVQSFCGILFHSPQTIPSDSSFRPGDCSIQYSYGNPFDPEKPYWYYHTYAISLNAGDGLTVVAASSEIDPWLDLLKLENGRPVGIVISDDDSGGGTSARIDYLATSSGLYQIRVVASRWAEVGNYQLSVSRWAGQGAGARQEIRRSSVAEPAIRGESHVDTKTNTDGDSGFGSGRRRLQPEHYFTRFERQSACGSRLGSFPSRSPVAIGHDPRPPRPSDCGLWR